MSLPEVSRLERALEAYEDTIWYLRQVWRSTGKKVDSLPVEPSDLRKALAKGLPVDNILSVLKQFAVKEGVENFGRGLGSILYFSAADIAEWVKCSKRVFTLSPSLAEMLLATDLPDFTPREVKFVAPVFAVKLTESVKTATGEMHDFIIFRAYPEEDGVVEISARSYSPTLDGYKRFTPDQKRQVERLAKNRSPVFARRTSFCVREFDKSNYKGFLYNCQPDTPFSGLLGAEVLGADIAYDDRQTLFRLCFGLNLYLQSARSDDDSETRRVNRSRPTERGQSIVDEADIFDLRVSTAFSRRSRSEEKDEPSYEVKPHFRRGYWRRPRGSGQDPMAPKTEWVRPYWVHRDLIVQGVQPIGSAQKVS